MKIKRLKALERYLPFVKDIHLIENNSIYKTGDARVT